MSASDRSESRIAGLHLPIAMGLFTLGVVELAVEGATYGTVLDAADAIAFGGFTVLVVGTSRMLLSGTAGVDVAGARWWWVPLGLVTIGSLGLWWGPVAGIDEQTSAFAWATGLLLHVSVLLQSTLREGADWNVENGWPVLLAAAGAMGYGLVSALTTPLVPGGGIPRLVSLHLLLTGFVACTILAVVIEVLPRFTGRGLPRPLAGPLAGVCVIGPAVLGLGMAGSGQWLHAGAILEGVGLVGLGVALLFVVTNTGRGRISFLLYGTGGLSVAAGTALGAGIVLGYVPASWLPVHGLVNLLGFVGLVVLGAVIDLYAPALRSGADTLAWHNQTVTVLGVGGLSVFVVLVAWELADPRLGLAIYAAGLLLHTIGSVTRLT